VSLHRKRILRIVGSIVVTGLCAAYIVWKIDLHKTWHILVNADLSWFLLSFGLAIAATWPMAWRWQRLLRAKGIEERLGWLVRCYFVSWFVGQVLPTSLGGDASRIYETTRRHPGRGGVAAGSVLLERALGGVATLTLAAIGFALAIGRYDVGAYLWIEGAFILATIALGFVLFSRRVRRPLRRFVPLARAVRLERPLRSVYEGIHAYRSNPWLLVGVFGLTVFVQAWRVLSIWAAGKAVGVDLSPRPYYVMGPLLFLVLLVPFTINGLAVRESFFVSFLTRLDVSAEHAFATGFLFFLVTMALSLPGAVVLGWESLRGRPAQRTLESG
jgi:glycosyltransferase 2 family protein